uniref:Bactericidal permeability-increasing protein n=1 Tax=Ficedula albicollis TaxID=59894 RepID=U3JRT2_FICAL
MGVQSLAVACGALALCLALTTATNPGFVVRITQAGLDYANQQGIAILEKELAQLKLPDISGKSGKVHYDLSRLRLPNFRLPYSRITPVSNVGLQVSISKASAELDGNCRVKFLLIRSSGSFNLKVENVSIKIILRLGSDITGKPTISTSDCSASISKVRVLFSGKLGWLYNLFHKTIESRLRKNFESEVCDSVAKSVQNKLQKQILTLPVTVKVDNKTGIDYSLVAPPRATAQYLDLDLKGEFYSLAKRFTVPFSPLPLAFPSDHERMVYFGASSYFFNTAGIAYQKAGALVFEITEAMIPKEAGFRLDTSVFSAFIPQLEEMYPNMPMKFRLSAPTAPFLTIGPGGISFQPIVDAQAYAILPNSSLVPLFLLSLTIESRACMSPVLQAKAFLPSLPTSQVRVMQSIMNVLTSRVVLPRVNARLHEGWHLPIPNGVQLSNVLVKFHQNFLLLGADLHM